MSKLKGTMLIAGGVAVWLAIAALFVLGCYWIYRVTVVTAHWIGNQAAKEYVCIDKVKVIDTKPYYEDNGRYEDEAYQVTYEDGSKGIIDDPAVVQGGFYCRKEEWK